MLDPYHVSLPDCWKERTQCLVSNLKLLLTRFSRSSDLSQLILVSIVENIEQQLPESDFLFIIHYLRYSNIFFPAILSDIVQVELESCLS